jgi:hypothetical protein
LRFSILKFIENETPLPSPTILLKVFEVAFFLSVTSNLIVVPSDAEVKIDMSSTLLTELQKAASVLGVNDLVLSSDGTTIKLDVTDKKNATSNTFSRIVGEGNGVSFSMNFKIENLKVLEGNYEVFVSSKGISNFKNKDVDLEYFIALEPDSKYNV